jgi:glycine/D-amino acid oxidase-like deaminating enzyme
MGPQPTSTTATADCVVVGGGLVGVALAYELVCSGAEVVLVDRHDPGRATDAGAGILSPETYRDPDPGSFIVGCGAARHYESLVARLVDDGAGDTGYARTGSLLIAERPGDDEFMDDAVRLIRSRSPQTEEIDPDEARRHFPVLGAVRRALFNPAGRRVDGRTLRAALLAAAERRGLRIEHASVIAVDADPRTASVRGVRTEYGPIAAGAVALAGGAWTAELADAFDVSLPVVPLKGQIVHLRLPATDSSRWPIVQPVLGFYLVPWPDGRVACGGTMEADAGFDHRVTADGVLQLLRECLRTAPGLAQAELCEVRVGSRPASVDGIPLAGPLPGWSNAFVASGHGAEGLLLGPLTARFTAALVLGRPPGDFVVDAEVVRELVRWSPARVTT